ncbi:probable U3 small nucleolar RNA-associated protein 11 [Actinidia eriantha]|uniref:probable U3 small nucleolar RNA-associated protein 11 n=1 Tax=Actinidia eriantha TaxID=165200 RepID=UPI00258C57BA|nr:probable U3 small nucleolar RNA-associated protein 11 [Actinidia eriantha]
MSNLLVTSCFFGHWGRYLNLHIPLTIIFVYNVLLPPVLCFSASLTCGHMHHHSLVHSRHPFSPMLPRTWIVAVRERSTSYPAERGTLGKIEKLTALLQYIDNPQSSRHVYYAEDREDAKEIQFHTSKGGNVPFLNDVPDHIKRKTAASYRELEARKARVKDLEKLYKDMALGKELQKKGRKCKLREDEIVCPTSKQVYKW